MYCGIGGGSTVGWEEGVQWDGRREYCGIGGGSTVGYEGVL